MAGEFWLDDQQWAVIAPLLPTNQPGAHRTDDRRVISGIIHVLRSGCRWQDCPPLATGLQQPSTIASIAGLRKEYGGGCLKLWRKQPIGIFI
ncbi:transposase [Rhizobium ruizarguesonis]|nr:transposase [Rhizobium ruizarguesonis]